MKAFRKAGLPALGGLVLPEAGVLLLSGRRDARLPRQGARPDLQGDADRMSGG
jgi:hypothetical protein